MTWNQWVEIPFEWDDCKADADDIFYKIIEKMDNAAIGTVNACDQDTLWLCSHDLRVYTFDFLRFMRGKGKYSIPIWFCRDCASFETCKAAKQGKEQ